MGWVIAASLTGASKEVQSEIGSDAHTLGADWARLLEDGSCEDRYYTVSSQRLSVLRFQIYILFYLLLSLISDPVTAIIYQNYLLNCGGLMVWYPLLIPMCTLLLFRSSAAREATARSLAASQLLPWTHSRAIERATSVGAPTSR